MAKKSEEVKNGLVEETVETTPDTVQQVANEVPVKEVTLNKTAAKVASPGHATRAFRG